MVYVVGDGAGAKNGIDEWVSSLISPTPTVTTKPSVNPLTGAPVTPPAAPVQPKAPPSTVASSGTSPSAADIGYDVPVAPFINNNLHPLSETTFTLGRQVRKAMYRGTMVRISDKAGSTDRAAAVAGMGRYSFRFLYNPESININSNVFSGAVGPEYRNPDDPLGAKFVGQESASFGLMLDRTQEVYEEGAERSRGTLPDLEALYRVVNGTRGMSVGFLYLSEVEIHWGPGNALPVFRGYVTSINVTHTKFSATMTPIRSIVDLSVARLADAVAGNEAIGLFGGASTATEVPTGLVASSGGPVA